MAEPSVKVIYFTDLLCIWAYVAQARLDEALKRHGDRLSVEYRFMPVFASVDRKCSLKWDEKGGYKWYNEHIHTVVQSFSHVTVHPQVWLDHRPRSSADVHLFLKAVQIACHSPADHTAFCTLAWKMRLAFFAENLDISDRTVQFELCRQCGIDTSAVEAALNDGRAMAALFEDIEVRDEYNVKMSPTWVLNEGRQLLAGNVGFKVIEANLTELLDSDHPEQASWC